MSMPKSVVGAIVALGVTAGLAAPAQAFCGFYVSGAGGQLFNDATQVVLMRDGTRTVLSMQNAYKGPPDAFAMVVPVPVVLQKDNVKTLPRDIFDRVDQLAAPRLVEYWEQDPCGPWARYELAKGAGGRGMGLAAPAGAAGASHGVTIEAQFTVGEYEIVVLSAKDSTGLDTWLHENHYTIPDGAEPYLRPYVAGGSKFFVAKVDTTKVKFEGGHAVLSPLRFHYDTDKFTLPIRLGLVNSAGTQDLVVNILARAQRYEAANYGNVTIPSNIDVGDDVRTRFGSFYAALFDRTLERNPRSVVTEYSWDSNSCDPCPVPALTGGELLTLGADVLPGVKPETLSSWNAGGFVLTRLHARYAKDSLGDDLVFQPASPIEGGREWGTAGGTLERGAKPSSTNNFQARYAIRHRWQGPAACEHPTFGVWGGPPPDAGITASTSPQAAAKLAYAPRGGVELPKLLREDVPELALKADFAPPSIGGQPPPLSTNTTNVPGEAGPAPPPADSAASGSKPSSSACGCDLTDGRGIASATLSVLGLLALLAARRRSRV